MTQTNRLQSGDEATASLTNTVSSERTKRLIEVIDAQHYFYQDRCRNYLDIFQVLREDRNIKGRRGGVLKMRSKIFASLESGFKHYSMYEY